MSMNGQAGLRLHAAPWSRRPPDICGSKRRMLRVSRPIGAVAACEDSYAEVAVVSDPRFDMGLLDVSDAARFLGIGRSKLRRWATGTARGGPLLHMAPEDSGRAPVTFITMMEAHVLDALSTAGVRPERIRPALDRLSQEFGQQYVLASRNLATDGIDVLWDFSRTSEGEGLMEGSTGQMVMREIVEDYLTYVTWADDGYPSTLQLRSCQPSKVVIDPDRAFGQPIFLASRTRVRDVAGMLKAGEDPQVVADEHGVSIEEVRTAARILLGRAA